MESLNVAIILYILAFFLFLFLGFLVGSFIYLNYLMKQRKRRREEFVQSVNEDFEKKRAEFLIKNYDKAFANKNK